MCCRRARASAVLGVLVPHVRTGACSHRAVCVSVLCVYLCCVCICAVVYLCCVCIVVCVYRGVGAAIKRHVGAGGGVRAQRVRG